MQYFKTSFLSFVYFQNCRIQYCGFFKDKLINLAYLHESKIITLCFNVLQVRIPVKACNVVLFKNVISTNLELLLVSVPLGVNQSWDQCVARMVRHTAISVNYNATRVLWGEWSVFFTTDNVVSYHRGWCYFLFTTNGFYCKISHFRLYSLSHTHIYTNSNNFF